MTLYYRLTQETGLYQENAAQSGAFKKLRAWLWLLGRGLFRTPFCARGPKKYVIYTHDRKPGGRDIYSDQITREANNEALLIDPTLDGTDIMKGAYTMGPFMLASQLYRKLKSLGTSPLSDSDRQKIGTVEKAMADKFGVGVSLTPLITERLHKFRFLVPIYKAILRRKNVQHVYIVNPYSHPFIVAAAHDLGLKISELQHGLTTPYHLGYSYPGRERVPYFPDEFLCFGRYWSESVPLPTATKTSVIGAPHIAQLLDKNVPKTPRSIFFSSQTVIGREVFDFALKTAQLLPDHTITLNLHPQDSLDRYKADGAPKNFTILHKPPGFFELLASHEFQAGSFSTTLFEGMMLGNKVIVLDLPGSENMEPAVKRGDALFARTPEELVSLLDHVRPAPDASDYYARPVERILD